MKKTQMIVLGIALITILVSVTTALTIIKNTDTVSSMNTHFFPNDQYRVSTGNQPLVVEYANVSIDNILVPLGGSSIAYIDINDASNLIIASFNITWDPSVLQLIDVKNTIGPFDTVLYEPNNDIGYVRIGAWKFGEGLSGDFVVCGLEFEPAIGSTNDDWSYVNFTQCDLYNQDMELICGAHENGLATITGDDILAHVSIDDMYIPISENGYTMVTIEPVSDLIIATVNITFDPSVVQLTKIYHTLPPYSPFSQVLNITNNEMGFVKVQAVKFGEGLYGDLTLCGLNFTSADGANDGDWCDLTFTHITLYNESHNPIYFTSEDGIATLFGEEPPEFRGTISGYKFHDYNENGIWDDDEPELPGWEIRLDDSISTYTDSKGYYEFTDLPAGEYIVEEIISGECWKNITPKEVPITLVDENITVKFGNKEITSTSTLSLIKQVSSSDTESYYDTVILDVDDPRWVIFKLSVTSDGSFNEVHIEDTLPTGFVYDDSYTQPGWILPDYSTDGYVYWQFSDVADDWSKDLYFRANVEDGYCGEKTNNGRAWGRNDCMDDYETEDSVTIDIKCQTNNEIVEVEKLVKPDCEDDLYDEEIQFFDGDYDFVTYKIEIDVDEGFDTQLIELNVKDNLPQIEGLQFYTNDTYVKDGEGNYFNDYTFEMNDEYLYWNFTYVEPGAHYSIYYCAYVLTCGLYENWVNITGFYYDGGPCCPVNVFVNDSSIVDVTCPSGPWIDKKASLDGSTWVDDGVECVIGDTVWFKIRVGTYDEPLIGVNVYDYFPDFLEFVEVIEDSNPDYFEEGPDWLRWFYQEVDETIEIIFTTEVIGLGSEENIVSVGTNCTEGYIEDSVWVNVSEGMIVNKRVSTDNDTWFEEIDITTETRVWWKIQIDYSILDTTLILYDIEVKDILPDGVTYVEDSAFVSKSDGTTMILNPVIVNNTLTWRFINQTGYVLTNGTWLSIIFATDITIDPDVNTTLTNWVNVTAQQCNDTTLFERDDASIHILIPQNHKPTMSDFSPEQDAENVSITTELEVRVDDYEDETLTVVFYNATDDSIINTISSVNPPKTVSTTWDDLTYNTTYTWYVTVSDATHTVTSVDYQFTTGPKPANLPPDTPTNPAPGHQTTVTSNDPLIAIHVSDPDEEDTLSVTFYDASDDSIIGTDSCSNDCTASVTWNDREDDTTYSWYVKVSDGIHEVTSDTWEFTVEEQDIQFDLELKSGFGLTFLISNIGKDIAEDVNWDISIQSTSGIGNIDEQKEGSIPAIGGGVEVFKKFRLFTLGRVEITATADCNGAMQQGITKEAIILGFIVIIQ